MEIESTAIGSKDSYHNAKNLHAHALLIIVDLIKESRKATNGANIDR